MKAFLLGLLKRRQRLVVPEPLLAPAVFPETLPVLMDSYLADHGNSSEEIEKLHQIFEMDCIILDIGCGNGEIAWEIAFGNPQTGVIATDKYDWTIPLREGSHYQKLGQTWKNKGLGIQSRPLKNFVLLRAEADIVSFFPDGSIDTILLINPEPLVGKNFIEFISDPSMLRKIKPGNRQIVVKPFSREMGVTACGGYEFEHSEDWSKGLGFLLGSPLKFKAGEKIQWLVDLSAASPYSKNSTQTCVYVYGSLDL